MNDPCRRSWILVTPPLGGGWLLVALMWAGEGSGMSAATGGRMGSAVCRECHPAFHEKWANSMHGASLREVDAAWAIERWGGTGGAVQANGQTCRWGMADGRVWVWTGNGAGKERHLVTQVVGGRHVDYLLTRLAGEKLQVLPMAFDVTRREWFNPAASAVRHGGGEAESALDWRSPAYTFNESCYACHVSQIREAAGAPGGSGRVAWDEPGISCETCHGPAEGHVRVCREVGDGPAPQDLRIISTRRFSAAQVNDLCAPCHARQTAITACFRPGERFFDHFDLLGGEDGDFTVDGRERGETYTYSLWQRNPCARGGGLSCLHCHTSSGRNRFPGDRANESCLPCHAALVQEVEAHAHHRAGREGSRCVDCHMPANDFARIRRHDHSLLPPTPSATRVFGTPNACNDCHRDCDAVWADAHVRRWHEDDYQASALRKARWMAAARERDWSKLDGMLASLRTERDDAFYLVGLIRLLSACDDLAKVASLKEALSHASPWVRAAAAQGLHGHVGGSTVGPLLGAARDESRLVRIMAARTLAPLPRELLEDVARQELERSAREFEEAMKVRPGDPGALETLGHFLLDGGQAVGASAAFGEALAAGGDSAALQISAATAAWAAGDAGTAENRLQKALETHPREPAVWFNWMVFLDRQGRGAEVTAARRTAERRLSVDGRRELQARWDRWRGG